MEKLCMFLVLALIASEASCMSFRHKRQAPEEDSLDDRYGWDRPSRPWDIPNFPLPDIFGQQQLPNQWPNSGQNQQTQPQQQTTTPAANNGAASNSALRECMRACIVTSEYNPVCGTDLVVYNNPGMLSCAQSCGQNVSFLRAAPCPSTTTVAPS